MKGMPVLGRKKQANISTLADEDLYNYMIIENLAYIKKNIHTCKVDGVITKRSFTFDYMPYYLIIYIRAISLLFNRVYKYKGMYRSVQCTIYRNIKTLVRGKTNNL